MKKGVGCSSPHLSQRLENWGVFVIPEAVWRVRKTSSPQRGSHTHRSLQRLCWGLSLQPGILGGTSDFVRLEGRPWLPPWLLSFSQVPVSIFHSSLPLFYTARSPPPFPSLLLSFSPFLLPSHWLGQPRWGPTPRPSGICAGPLSALRGSSGNAPSAGQLSLRYFFLTASVPRASQH